MMRAWLFRAFIALGVLLLTKRAAADERVVSLEYAAPEACPPRALFESLVLARTKRVRFEDTSTRRASVRVVAAKGRFRGALTIDGRDGASRAHRTVEAPTCEQLTEAMALVAAIAIDPEALTTPEEPAPSAIPTPPPPLPPAGIPASPEILRPPAAPAVAASPFALGGGLSMATSGAPDPIVGVVVRGEYEILSTSLFSPMFGAEVAVGTSDFFAVGTSVAIARASMRVEGCPFRVTVRDMDFRVCGGASCGVLRARGIGISRSETAVRPWLDVDMRIRARWESHARLRWFFGIDAGPAFPITRPTFVFLQPRAIVYETPPIGLETALIVGRHF